MWTQPLPGWVTLSKSLSLVPHALIKREVTHHSGFLLSVVRDYRRESGLRFEESSGSWWERPLVAREEQDIAARINKALPPESFYVHFPLSCLYENKICIHSRFCCPGPLGLGSSTGTGRG